MPTRMPGVSRKWLAFGLAIQQPVARRGICLRTIQGQLQWYRSRLAPQPPRRQRIDKRLHAAGADLDVRSGWS